MDRVGSLVGQRFGKLQVIKEAGFITGSNGRGEDFILVFVIVATIVKFNINI